jgi:hypothetical protein
MLKIVISGGQTGADRGGLYAAEAVGLGTGGWMPKGFLALDGSRPDLAARFRLQQHTSENYPPRTRLNVLHADATLRIARHWGSPGERLTLKFIMKFSKPWIDIDPANETFNVESVVEFLKKHRVAILNVAGNSESTAPGIEALSAEFLIRVFEQVKA